MSDFYTARPPTATLTAISAKSTGPLEISGAIFSGGVEIDIRHISVSLFEDRGWRLVNPFTYRAAVVPKGCPLVEFLAILQYLEIRSNL